MYENDIYSGTGNTENRYGVYSGANNYRSDDTGSRSNGNNHYNNGEDFNKKPRQKGFFKKALSAIVLGTLFGAFAGGAFFAVDTATSRFAKTENKEAAVVDNSTISLEPDEIKSALEAAGISLSNVQTVTESDISGVVEDVMPAMVSIINNYTETTQNIWGQRYSQELSASGSGIIVSENDTELLIVSNAHVVESATSLDVTFIDGSTATAKIKGLDTEMDLAVIAVNKEDLEEATANAITIATLGDSDNLKLGEPVIAIGNALGYGQSVTNGIVSALDREIELEDGSTGTFIQTNAAINPGNSGGALLNINGEVIGINSSKIGGSAIEGMGYAIPISSASPIISELLLRETRDVVDESERGYIGITLQEVTGQIAQMYNMPEGVFVVTVEEGSGAEACGIISGDIITKFDGQRISSYSELQDTLQYYSKGDTAKITIKRLENGEYVEHNYDITLGERPNTNR